MSGLEVKYQKFIKHKKLFSTVKKVKNYHNRTQYLTLKQYSYFLSEKSDQAVHLISHRAGAYAI
jgi:hypothetical protein